MIYYIILYCNIMRSVLFCVIVIVFAKHIIHKCYSSVHSLVFNGKCLISLFLMNLSSKVIHKSKISLFGIKDQSVSNSYDKRKLYHYVYLVLRIQLAPFNTNCTLSIQCHKH